MIIDVSPIAFSIGSLSVRWYGIMVALAVIFLILWMLRSVRKGANISYDTVLNAALVGIPSGIVFSRLLHVLDYWEHYSQNPGDILGASGLTIYGAVLGATLGIWIYSRFSKQSFGYLADVIAPGIIMAQAIGRVGCVLNGCCYGLETDIFCAVIYTSPDSFAPIGVPVHPTQIYEIIYNVMLFGVLLLLRGRFKPDGTLFLIYLGLYSVWRLSIGFLREGMPFLFELHQAQVIAIVVVLIALYVFAFKAHWVKKVAEEGQEDREV